MALTYEQTLTTYQLCFVWEFFLGKA